MRCIIFVERKIATRVLASLLGSIEVLSSRFRFQPLAGKGAGLNVMNRKLQQHVVESFRDGEVSISTVICFCQSSPPAGYFEDN
jgi:ERCC4-related helicase